MPVPKTAIQTLDPADCVVFAADLQPHRSLDRRGVHLFMGFLGLILGPPAGVFLVTGAWPIVGFMGLEVIGLYVAFRVNLIRGRLTERLEMTARELKVQRIDHWGKRQVWRFTPQWLAITMDDPPQHESKLVLSLREQRLVIGAFLTPEERLDLAKSLQEAVNALKAPVPQPA